MPADLAAAAKESLLGAPDKGGTSLFAHIAQTRAEEFHGVSAVTAGEHDLANWAKSGFFQGVHFLG